MLGSRGPPLLPLSFPQGASLSPSAHQACERSAEASAAVAPRPCWASGSWGGGFVPPLNSPAFRGSLAGACVSDQTLSPGLLMGERLGGLSCCRMRLAQSPRLPKPGAVLPGHLCQAAPCSREARRGQRCVFCVSFEFPERWGQMALSVNV